MWEAVEDQTRNLPVPALEFVLFNKFQCVGKFTANVLTGHGKLKFCDNVLYSRVTVHELFACLTRTTIYVTIILKTFFGNTFNTDAVSWK
jgi:hypothetical protein